MPQVVTDLLEAIAGFEQMTGTGVSQPVWAIAFCGQSHDGKISPHETTQSPIRQSAVGARKVRKRVRLWLGGRPWRT